MRNGSQPSFSEEWTCVREPKILPEGFSLKDEEDRGAWGRIPKEGCETTCFQRASTLEATSLPMRGVVSKWRDGCQLRNVDQPESLPDTRTWKKCTCGQRHHLHLKQQNFPTFFMAAIGKDNLCRAHGVNRGGAGEPACSAEITEHWVPSSVPCISLALPLSFASFLPS